jgi:hypothetical protein
MAVMALNIIIQAQVFIMQGAAAAVRKPLQQEQVATAVVEQAV